MHYYVNHLAEDYLNDIKITHIYNTQMGSQQASHVETITAEQIANNNGVVNYTVNATGAWNQDPNNAIIMEVEPGVLLTDLQNNPTVNSNRYIPAVNREMKLNQNVPNPFKSSTSIKFTLNRDLNTQVKLAVYNSNGEIVRILKNGIFGKGSFTVEWNGKDAKGMEAPNGVYFCRLITGNSMLTRRMILLR
jgi:hypothetical protein